MKTTLFIQQLGKYFEIYLPKTGGYSQNTISSYKDAFRLLFKFMDEIKGIRHYLIDYKHFTVELMEEFILWLEEERNYSASSRNQRHASISAYFKYASRREMDALSAFNRISAVPSKKTPSVAFPYFTVKEIGILLKVPDVSNRLGRRDQALLCLLYDSASRAQELCGVTVVDVRFGRPTRIKLHGKGRKTREIPLTDECSKLIKQYIKSQKLDNEDSHAHPLFSSQTHEKMTTSCIRNIVEKYVGLARIKCPEMFREANYSPHSFRHSKSVHMVEAGIQIIYIRDFLGHTTIQSTERYAKVSQMAITKALTERKIPNVIPVNESDETVKKSFPGFLE
ncbi:site-specific integrase [Clostridium estertheticum]|uniref:tyrosine-type recombinase/integrase n=1 Tax=Clostridium estertheticum TaxID=238834 RepID=UPI0013E905C9|nr:tyrosine-type recombinase/integrase [Clostridium estertheticum]MBZ9685336.1 site-specific integrase [Clostridium estertheticum]